MASANLRPTALRQWTDTIIIGADNMWSYQEVVMDSDIHQIFNMDGVQINKPGEILFGNNVWLGARCTILKNISIAHDSIIGSSSIISKSLDSPHSIYVGSPARLVKSGIKWKRDTLVPVHP